VSDPTAPNGAAVDLDATREVLTSGELKITGRLTNASNATLYGTVKLDGIELTCVHKPVAGERPLWDFPTGTLSNREVAAYEVSQATGWGIVPPTVMRDGPWGPGMCQLWIHTADDPDSDPDADAESDSGTGDGSDDSALLTLLPEDSADVAGWRPILQVEMADGRPAVLAHRDDTRLRRIAAYDVVINNADRKGGHLLVGTAHPDHVYGIDHGVTFAVEDKLRTLLWGFAGEPLGTEIRGTLEKLELDLASGPLAGRLGGLLDPDEVESARGRVRELLRADCFPGPEGRRRAVPWPPI
jgi:uncharacterized repeat protein (TIGR03843 family)